MKTLPENKYISKFFGFHCAPDMLKYKLFPNVKEITESMAALYAAINYLPELSRNDSSISVVVVGDGHTPRTAALFALNSSWTCYSVDPVMRLKEYPFDRLYQHKANIEDVNFDFGNDPVIIIAVHCHASMGAMLKSVRGMCVNVISIPCCVVHEIKDTQSIEYTDVAIWSEKNVVKVWKNLNNYCCQV